jgi:hypothetical protein
LAGRPRNARRRSIPLVTLCASDQMSDFFSAILALFAVKAFNRK